MLVMSIPKKILKNTFGGLRECLLTLWKAGIEELNDKNEQLDICIYTSWYIYSLTTLGSDIGVGAGNGNI